MLDLIHAIIFQVITVNSSSPCFFNYTAGAAMWQQCGVGTDYLKAFLLPWDWATGGNFSMILVSVFILMSYIKYQKVVYPVIIGVIFLPLSYAFFPVPFINFGIIMAFVGVGLLVAYIFYNQTNEN